MPDQELNIFKQVTAETKSPFDIEKLSDKFKFRNTGWSIPEAFLGVLFGAALADGNFAPTEQQTILMIAGRSRALSSLSPADLAAANDAVSKRMQQNPSSALQEACQTLPADMCLPVFAHCVDIILSDGQLVKSEAEFLERLASMLDIPTESSRRVMEVLLLKAQY